MNQQHSPPPGSDELRNFGLGKCDPVRAAEIEAFLISGADCSNVLEAAPDDALVRHLRGAGSVPPLDATPAVDQTRVANPVAALLDHPRYHIIRKLGEGGMGVVYLAEHRFMQRRVALKFLRPGCLATARAVERFRREVRAAAQLSHPHVVAAYDADEAGGTHFLVMEYVDGVSLDRWLSDHGPLPAAEACDYARQAALGLQAAHELGMAHRDIKPHNLMRTADGRIKVLDFGLVRAVQDTQLALPELGTAETAAVADQITAEVTGLGTADYVAPEQALDGRAADTRSDVYSLGCTLYQLLTGRVPFPGGTAQEKVARHAATPPEPLTIFRPDLPAGLPQVVARMMAKQADSRYPTPAAVATALEPFTRPEVVMSRRRWLLAATGAIVLPLSAVGVHRLGWTRQPADPNRHVEAPKSNPAPVQPAQPVRGSLEAVRDHNWKPLVGGVGTTFSQDGRRYAAWDGASVRVWETESGEPVHTITGLPRATLSTRFLPGGDQLVSSHTDGSFCVWNLKTGTQSRHLQTLPGWNSPQSASGEAFSFLVMESGPAQRVLVGVWDIQSDSPRFTVGRFSEESVLISHAMLSPDGTRLLTADVRKVPPLGEGVVRVFDALTGVELRRFSVAVRPYNSVVWSPDGQQIYLSASESPDFAGVLVRLDLDTGTILSKTPLVPKPGSSHGRHFSPDCRWFAVQYPQSNMIHLYDVATGTLIADLATTSCDFSLSFSCDGRFVAWGRPDGAALFRVTTTANPDR